LCSNKYAIYPHYLFDLNVKNADLRGSNNSAEINSMGTEPGHSHFCAWEGIKQSRSFIKTRAYSSSNNCFIPNKYYQAAETGPNKSLKHKSSFGLKRGAKGAE